MSVVEWANRERLIEYHQNDESQKTIDTFQKLLEGQSTPDASVRTLVSIFGDHGPDGIWGYVCSAARALGNDEEVAERLVHLLDGIAETPPDLFKYPHVREWNWMPMRDWGWVFWEHGIDFREDEFGEEQSYEGEWIDRAAPLLNATSFAATYLDRGTSDGARSMPSCIERLLSEGLEATIEQQQRRTYYLPPAAVCMKLAGGKIYQLCKDDHDRKDSRREYEDRLWDKGIGFSLERWAFWKRRFQDVAEEEKVDDNLQKIAVAAAEDMEKVEKATRSISGLISGLR